MDGLIPLVSLWMVTLPIMMETCVQQLYTPYQPQDVVSDPVICQRYPETDKITCAGRCAHQLCDAFKIENEGYIVCLKRAYSAAVPLNSLASPRMFIYGESGY